MNLIRIALQTSILTSVVLTGLGINGDAARSQQRACVITDDGATVCGKPTAMKKETKKPAQSSGYRKEAYNFVFSLKGCKRADTTIKCDLAIVNKSVERSLSLYIQNTKIVDSEGKSHTASTIEIGGTSTSYPMYPTLQIIPGIDYATTITFENISEQITQAQVLELSLEPYSNANSPKFRKVSFSN